MAKAPHRTVSEPAEGGALPRAKKAARIQPRNAAGVFVKAGDATAIVSAAKPAKISAPKPRRTSKRAPTPAQLVARVTRAIEGELMQIESIIAGARVSAAKRAEAEQRTRALGSLVRTMAETMKLRDSAKEARGDDDDNVPRDLDEFRESLQRRLAEAVGLRPPDDPGGDVAERDGLAERDLADLRS